MVWTCPHHWGPKNPTLLLSMEKDILSTAVNGPNFCSPVMLIISPQSLRLFSPTPRKFVQFRLTGIKRGYLIQYLAVFNCHNEEEPNAFIAIFRPSSDFSRWRLHHAAHAAHAAHVCGGIAGAAGLSSGFSHHGLGGDEKTKCLPHPVGPCELLWSGPRCRL